MDSLNPAIVTVYFVGGLVAIAFILVLFRPLWMPLWRMFRRAQQFFEDWFGEPARPDVGQPARPGAMARLAQLEHNGGATMRDAIVRIEQKFDVVEERAQDARELAAEAARLAGQAAAEAARDAELQAAERERAAERHRENRERLERLEAERRAGWLREQTYLASLRELGFDIEIDPGPARSMPRTDDPLP